MPSKNDEGCTEVSEATSMHSHGVVIGGGFV